MEVRKRTIFQAIWMVGIGLKFMVGTSNKSVPGMAIDIILEKLEWWEYPRVYVDNC